MTLQVGWDIRHVFKEPIVDILVSSRWSSIRFNNSEKIHIPKYKRGVYLVTITSKTFDDLAPFSQFKTPAYVGESTDLRKRFNDHTAGSGEDALWKRIPNEKRKYCKFWYTILDDRTSKQTLRQIEQELLNAYGCPLNRINSVTRGDIIIVKS